MKCLGRDYLLSPRENIPVFLWECCQGTEDKVLQILPPAESVFSCQRVHVVPGLADNPKNHQNQLLSAMEASNRISWQKKPLPFSPADNFNWKLSALQPNIPDPTEELISQQNLPGSTQSTSPCRGTESKPAPRDDSKRRDQQGLNAADWQCRGGCSNDSLSHLHLHLSWWK